MFSQAATPKTIAATPTAAARKRQLVMARQLRPNRPEGRHGRRQQNAKRDSRRPRRADENGGEIFDQAQRRRSNDGPRQLPRPPKTQIAKTRPINSRPTAGCSGSITIMKAPASAALAQAIPNAMRLMRTGETATSRSARRGDVGGVNVG